MAANNMHPASVPLPPCCLTPPPPSSPPSSPPSAHLVSGVLLPVWLGDADWRKRHAALICLAQIAEGCERLMQQQVEPLVAMCLTGLRDTHPKVGRGGGGVVGPWNPKTLNPGWLGFRRTLDDPLNPG